MNKAHMHGAGASLCALTPKLILSECFWGTLWHFVLYLVPRLLQSSFLFNVQGRKGILIASLRYINTWKCQQFARFEYCFMFIWLVFVSPMMSDSTEDPGKATRIPSEFLDFSPGTEANEEISPSVDEAGVVNENYGEQWWIKFSELSAESRYQGIDANISVKGQVSEAGYQCSYKLQEILVSCNTICNLIREWLVLSFLRSPSFLGQKRKKRNP